MDALRSLARSLGMLAALLLVVAVSGAFGDGINENRNEMLSADIGPARNFEAVETSLRSERFADFSNSGFYWGHEESFERISGIRDGYWLRSSFNKDNEKLTTSSDSPNSTVPEPASLLLLIAGVGPLLYARGRGLKLKA